MSIQRQQPVNESPISIQGRTNEVESPISIQRQRTTPESQLAVTRAATQAEPETPIAGSSSGPVVGLSGSIVPLLRVFRCTDFCVFVKGSPMMKHFHQTTSPPAPVREDQNEAPATGSQETEVVTLSSDDQDSNVGRSPTKRTRITSPGTSGSSRVTRARTRAMQGTVKPEPGVPADEAGPSTGSPITRRGGRAPDIRRTLPVRERSPLPSPMQNRTSTVAVNRIGSAVEIEELEWMLNSGSSSEWGDDQLPDDDQLIGTQSWTETSPDQLVVIYRSNFHQNWFYGGED